MTLNSKIRFFGVRPEKVNGEWLYVLMVLETGKDDTLDLVLEKGPFYRLELDQHLRIAIGEDKQRLFKEVGRVGKKS